MPTTPDLVIWRADGEPYPGLTYATRLAERLEGPCGTVTVAPVAERRLRRAEFHAPLHVLTGGSTPAENDRWHSSRDLLAQLMRSDGARVVGVCLGAQMIATVLGHPPRASRFGLEVGLRRVQPDDGSDPLAVAQFHYHEIPASLLDDTWVARTHHNDHTDVQGFDYRHNVRGLQFHPEMSPGDIAATAQANGELLRAHRIDPDRVSQGAFDDGPAWRPETLDETVTSFLLHQRDERPPGDGRTLATAG
jgi:GMP synthase-like glutamine amidotransferase